MHRRIAWVLVLALIGCGEGRRPDGGDAFEGGFDGTGEGGQTDAMDAGDEDAAAPMDIQDIPVDVPCDGMCPDRPNATGACMLGRCGIVCNAGFADCDRNEMNGCELDVRSDAMNCDACSMRCPAGQACQMGTCQACPSGMMACGGRCVDVTSDLMNCGACGMVCPMPDHATATCSMGMCGITCEMGWTNCNMMASDGCEANLEGDPNNCGVCGTRCMAPMGSSPSCAMGRCGLSCPPGRADCDGMTANGCEVDTSTSLANCGRCGNACLTRPNATSTCAGGTCGIRCNSGFENCDMNATNGCEVNSSTDVAHCGACGMRCTAPTGVTGVAPSCTMATCGITCTMAGRGDCNGMISDGCETNTLTSALHCGVCANRCPGNVVCTNGRCECPADGNSLACTLARRIADVAVGATATVTGTVQTSTDPGDWFIVTFTRRSPAGRFAPEVQMMDFMGNPYRLDVRYPPCATAATPRCSTGGTGGMANSLLFFQSTPNQSTAGVNEYTTRSEPFNDTLLFRVHRVSPTPGCEPYAVTVRNR